MARYLTGRGWPCEYERPVGDRKLDFYVHHPEVGPFAAEVYEPRLVLGATAGWVDSYTPLRRMFTGRKRRQMAAAKAAERSRTWRPRFIETGDTVVAQVPGGAVPNHSLTGNRGTVGGKFGTESVVLNGGCDDRDFGDQIIFGGGA
jgi:hypothetical protein